MKSKNEFALPKPKRTRYSKRKSNSCSYMDLLLKTPGFYHVATNIFKFLDIITLLNCRQVNSIWKIFFDNPWFWLQNCIQKNEMSDVHKKEWKLLIEHFEAKNAEKSLAKYLRKTFTKVNQEKHYQFHGLFKSAVNLACKYGELDILKAFQDLNILNDVINTADTEIRKMMKERYLKDYPTYTFLEPYLEEEEFYMPYHIACENGHLEIVKMLSAIYKDPIDSNPFHLTSLDYAVSGNHHHVVKYMIEKKFTIHYRYESRDDWGCTVFHRAARYSDAKMLDLLLNVARQDMDYTYDIITEPTSYNANITVLSEACEVGKFENVKFLYDWLEKCPDEDDIHYDDYDEDIDIQEPNEFGMSPLHRAASNGHLDIVKYLISKGANPNIDDTFGNTAIHHALLMKDPVNYHVYNLDLTEPSHLTESHIETVKFLASICKNPNKPNVVGKTPEYYALRCDNGKEILPFITGKKIRKELRHSVYEASL